MKKYFSLTLIVLIFFWCNSFGQEQTGPEPQVFQDVYHDTSPPLSELIETQVTQTQWEDGIIPLLTIPPRFDDQYEYDPSLQLINGNNGISIIVQNWDGVPAQGFAPPDPSGAVGLSHYMEMVNVRFQIWDKTGTPLTAPANLGTLWAGFPGPWASSLNNGDPIVLYDEAADRWFASQFSLPNGSSGPNYILIAISQTGDPTGSWHRYGFQFLNVPDYPKFGVWSDGYYVSANRFGPGGYVGTSNAVFERSMMLVGAAAQMVLFEMSGSTTYSLLPSDNDGAAPPGGAPNYFAQAHDNAFYGGSDGVDIYEFHVDWVTPANSTFGNLSFLPTSAFSMVNNIPQLGTGTTLDDLSDRMMNRLNYRNFGSHQSMVVCQTIDAGGSRAGIRWYEFRNTGGGWSLFQEGTYAPADGQERWMGSIAINSNGDICLGYSVSSSSIFPEIRFTGRLSGDPLGTMPITEETIFAGSGSQSGLSRWGDYTQMSVDPAEPEVFWYVNQYQPSTGSFNWRTRIAALDFALVPVELTSFNAVAANDEVEINWSTATETNNQGFQIQRKSGNSEFEEVGYVAGFGTTAEAKSYSFVDAGVPVGSYSYRLKQIDFSGKFEYTHEVNVDVTAPIEYALEQNHPNPFNPSTMIKYSIAEDGFVKLAVYNLTGEEVALLVNSQQKAGRYEIDFNASNLASGVYIYRMESANFISSKKLMLMK